MRRFIIGALCLLTFGCACNLEPGSGEKIGQIVRLNRTGLMCDTWEGQLIRGGMSDGSGTIGVTPFEFTIESQEMADRALKAMQEQTEVLIRYNIEGVYTMCRSSSSGHFLTSLQPAPPHARP